VPLPLTPLLSFDPPTSQVHPSPSLRKRKAAELLPLAQQADDLGALILDATVELNHSSSPTTVFRRRQGRGNFALLDRVDHPAKHLLAHLGTRGAPVVIQTPPWSLQRLDAAVARGPHKSAYEHQDFLRGEMADMVLKAIWIVLPYAKVRHWKNLRISPIGVVPQHGRRPRTIVDYSYYLLNTETLKLTPQESMQFGRALDRLITQTVRADPRFGPVNFIKIDISDGFYRVQVRAEDVPKLGVAFPSLEHEEPLVAFPLALPMGWTESPPYFCAVTETIADMANARILKGRPEKPHHLDRLANSKPPNTPLLYPAPTFDTPSVGIPKRRSPMLPSRSRILASIDVFVDDFIGLAQGSSKRLHRIRRTLMRSIDDVLRPLDSDDPPHAREPISVKKLKQGDASWSTVKNVLGWIIDSVAMTISLPQRRLDRLAELLSSIPLDQKRLSLDRWHGLLGELRSMTIALPGARGLFSSLQAALSTREGRRLRLSKGFHDSLQDFRWIHQDLARRPTRLQELVPAPPSLLGAHDASGYGAGGVWFPHLTVTPRSARVKSLRTDGTVRRHRLREARPIVWRYPIPENLQSRLVSHSNPSGDINNSDFELAGSLLQQEAAVQCYDVRERTTKDATDNLSTLFWSRKGSTTTTGPPAKLLRIAAIHQRHHRYTNLKDFLPGRQNKMADDASRLNHLSDQQFLTHFNLTFPQTPNWVLWTPTSDFLSAVTSALRKQTSPPASFLREPPPPLATGPRGVSTVQSSDWILPYKSMKIPSPFCKSSSTATELESSLPAVNKSDLGLWRMPYAALDRRLRQWGPSTHVKTVAAASTSACNAN
jgi:hypothetical protein